MKTTQGTAAGPMVDVFATDFAPTRGGARIWFGQLKDGRFAVASRFQWEILTKNRGQAAKVFRGLTVVLDRGQATNPPQAMRYPLDLAGFECLLRQFQAREITEVEFYRLRGIAP